MMQLFAEAIIALIFSVSFADYAIDICQQRYKIKIGFFGTDTITAADGSEFSSRYDCGYDCPESYSSCRKIIGKCSLEAAAKFSVPAESTATFIADTGARFYDLTCLKTNKATIQPSAFFTNHCTDDLAAREGNAKSEEKQADTVSQNVKDVVDDVPLPDRGGDLKVTYSLTCFDQPRVSNCTFAGGNRLKSPVVLSPGKSSYIVDTDSGNDYSLTCNAGSAASISQVNKTYADELCKADVNAAWEQTVKSNYATYPSEDQLIVKKEATLTVDTSSAKIVYTVQCFSEPARIQQCSFAGGSRLRDSVDISPAYKTGAYILKEGKMFLLTCYESASAQLAPKKATGADEVCEDIIQQQQNERKKKGAKFSLAWDGTKKVIALKRPSPGPKVKVAVYAMCLGDRPIFKWCETKRKGANLSNNVTAGQWRRRYCIDVGIFPVRAYTKLRCEEFDLPRFTTKAEKQC